MMFKKLVNLLFEEEEIEEISEAEIEEEIEELFEVEAEEEIEETSEAEAEEEIEETFEVEAEKEIEEWGLTEGRPDKVRRLLLPDSTVLR